MAVKKPPPVWDYKKIRDLTRGVDKTLGDDDLPDGFSSVANNVRFEGGKVLADTGYGTYADTVIGIPQAIHTWVNNAGTSETVLITTLSVYKGVVVSSAEKWQMVKGAQSTTVNATEAAGQTVITVSSISGFTNGAPIGIILDDGNQHKTTLVSSAGSELTITDALPSQTTATKVVVQGPILAGTTTNPVSYATWAPDNWMVFNNDVDAPQRYDGTDCIKIPGMAGSGSDPSITRAKWITVKRNQIFLLGESESGTIFPVRIRACDIADGSDWNDAAIATNAFFEDIHEDLGRGQRLEALGNDVTIYFDDGIVRYEFLGLAGLLWRYTVVVRGTGLIAPLALVAQQGRHIFVSDDDIFIYQGYQSLRPLGRKGLEDRSAVKNSMFGITGDLNVTAKNTIFLIYVDALSEFWIFYPTATSSFPDKMWRFNQKTNSWASRTFTTNKFLGAGQETKLAAETWNTVSGTWANAAYSWHSIRLTADAPFILLCAQDANQVYNYDFLATQDDTTAISWVIETGDMSIEGLQKFRTDLIDILALGTAITVSFSVDRGASFTGFSSSDIAPGVNLVNTRLYKQLITDIIRIRFEGTTPATIDSFGLRLRPESVI